MWVQPPASLEEDTVAAVVQDWDPRAQGTAILTRTGSGWEIQLAVTGLPHRAGGGYYEGWLQDAAGERVAVGTFNDGLT